MARRGGRAGDRSAGGASTWGSKGPVWAPARRACVSAPAMRSRGLCGQAVAIRVAGGVGRTDT